MPARVEWHGEMFQQVVRVKLNRAVDRMAAVAVGQIKVNLNRGGGAVRHTSRNTGRVYWSGPGAPPGEYPFSRSGNLRRMANATAAVNLRARVGSSPGYGFYLEERTGRMRARPWLRRSIDAAAPRMRQVFIQQATLGVEEAARTSVIVSGIRRGA